MADRGPDVRGIAVRGVLVTAATLGVAAAVTRWAGGPVRALGAALVAEGGVLGLFLLVVATEIVPSPLAFLPWIVLALEGGMAPEVVAATVGVGSVLAAGVDYAIGRRLGVPARWSARLAASRPELLELLRRRGALAVAFVGMLPLPFGLVTVPAGALRVSPRAFALAVLVRIPKAAVFVVFLDAT